MLFCALSSWRSTFLRSRSWSAPGGVGATSYFAPIRPNRRSLAGTVKKTGVRQPLRTAERGASVSECIFGSSPAFRQPRLCWGKSSAFCGIAMWQPRLGAAPDTPLWPICWMSAGLSLVPTKATVRPGSFCGLAIQISVLEWRNCVSVSPPIVRSLARRAPRTSAVFPATAPR